jgi:prophage regulatory protein
MEKLIRLSALASSPKRAGLIPLSRTTIWRLVRSGEFPPPVKVGGRATCWLESEVVAYLQGLKRVGG